MALVQTEMAVAPKKMDEQERLGLMPMEPHQQTKWRPSEQREKRRGRRIVEKQLQLQDVGLHANAIQILKCKEQLYQ